ncbi:hypothetical protein ACWCXC_03555 [Streptomyces sp. NPDC001515]
MNRFVRVEARPFPEVLYAHCSGGSLRVRLGPGGHGHPVSVIDEHLVVDTDACRDGSLLDCADVLQASRARSVTGARRLLAELLSAHPACGLAAVPLARADTPADGCAGGCDRGGECDGGAAVSGRHMHDGCDRGSAVGGAHLPGGWALACGADTAGGMVVVDCRSGTPSAGAALAGQSLLPSCLHAWLVAGRALREWPYAREAPLPL